MSDVESNDFIFYELFAFCVSFQQYIRLKQLHLLIGNIKLIDFDNRNIMPDWSEPSIGGSQLEKEEIEIT